MPGPAEALRRRIGAARRPVEKAAHGGKIGAGNEPWASVALGVFASVPVALTRREHRGAEVRVRPVRRSLDQRPPCPKNASE